MRVLLDTQVLLWGLFQPERLSSAAADVLADGETELLVSPASPYELEWKKAAGKLQFPDILNWTDALQLAGFAALPIAVGDAERAARLPIHHRDPWDRLIIAQALAGGAPIVTSDRIFERYGVSVIW